MFSASDDPKALHIDWRLVPEGAVIPWDIVHLIDWGDRPPTVEATKYGYHRGTIEHPDGWKVDYADGDGAPVYVQECDLPALIDDPQKRIENMDEGDLL